MSIQLAEADAQILACLPTMSQLRPNLHPQQFLQQVQRQMAQGYHLIFLRDTHVVAVAGFRISECLAWGKFMYIEDLVVDQQVRSQGYGQQLWQWLLEYAKQHQCQQLHLDSGVQRSDAHRFYFHQRMSIAGYHFVVSL